MTEKITSTANPRIKNIIRLSKPGERRRQDLIVIEGCREIAMAAESGFELRELYVAEELGLGDGARALLAGLPAACETVQVSSVVFERIAYRGGSGGLLALAVPRYMGLEELALGPNPFLMVLESPEKPGNIGAILRTADAANLDAVLVCDPRTDIYNPNVIRASLGCVFTRRVVTCGSAEAAAFLRAKGIGIFPAALTAQKAHWDADYTGPCAIAMGSEADGLTDIWLDNIGTPVKIPMDGRVDSLNLSTSAAIIVYEAKRQRDAASRGGL